MKPIAKMWLVQIEVTNACFLQCANCTRFVGHHRSPFYMDFSVFERSLDSLTGFSGGVGIIGGEPTLHPDFERMCALLRRKLPPGKRALWTSGYKWDEYKNIIQETFGNNVYYNDHTGEGQKHQPVLVAIDEVLPDKKYMCRLINRCWVQQRWSASITPKGCFFCEVAAALDILFEGPGGWPIERDWWRRRSSDYQEQICRYCYRCSCALPLPACANTGADVISRGNYEILRALGSPKILKGSPVVIIDRTFSSHEIKSYARRWRPWNYLGSDIKRSSRPLYGKLRLHKTE